jgi:CRISPR/Cas system-associated protein Cas5 (RAMP superfamily)
MIKNLQKLFFIQKSLFVCKAQKRTIFSKIKETFKNTMKSAFQNVTGKLVNRLLRNTLKQNGELQDLALYDAVKMIDESKEFKNKYGEISDQVIPPLNEEIETFTEEENETLKKFVKFSFYANSEMVSNLKIEILAQEVSNGNLKFHKIEIYEYEPEIQSYTLELDLMNLEKDNIIETNFIEK